MSDRPNLLFVFADQMRGMDVVKKEQPWEEVAGPDSVLLLEPVIVDQGAAQGVREWRGLRTKRYTYARWYDGRPWLLYDNEADPYQMSNLVDSPEHASVRTELERELDARLAATGDRSLSWQETIRSLGLQREWARRERYMHPNAPRLLTGPAGGALR